MAVHRTGNGAYAIQQIGYGSTGAAENTAGKIDGAALSLPFVNAALFPTIREAIGGDEEAAPVIVEGTGTLAGAAVTVTGNATVDVAGAGTLAGAAGTVSGNATIGVVAGTGTLAGAANTSAGSGAVDVAGTGTLAGAAGTVSGAASVAVAGAGTLAGSAQTVAGDATTAIAGAGTLAGAANSTAGNATIGTVTGAGTLDSAANTTAGVGAVSVAGTGTMTGSAGTAAGPGVVDVAGAGTLAGAAQLMAGAAAVDVAGAGTLAGAANTSTGNATVSFSGGDIAGTGTLASGAGTMSGDATVTGGVAPTPPIVVIPVPAQAATDGASIGNTSSAGLSALARSVGSRGVSASQASVLVAALGGARVDLVAKWLENNPHLTERRAMGRKPPNRRSVAPRPAGRYTRTSGGTASAPSMWQTIQGRVMTAASAADRTENPRQWAAPSGLGYLGAVETSCVTPSTQAAGALMRGESGSLVAFGLAFLGRALMIAPALALVGVRGNKLVTASLASSGAISLYILVCLRARGCGQVAIPV